MEMERGTRLKLATLLALTLAVALAAPTAAFALHEIEVIVEDAETGERVENAHVYVDRVLPSPPGSINGYTDADGWVGFTDPLINDSEAYRLRVFGPTADYRTHTTHDFTQTGGFTGRYIRLWQKVHRVWGPDRYTTAVQTARDVFGDEELQRWPWIEDVVLASGEDVAAADPLTAAGLCWAYDAPLVLVGRDHTPDSVKAMFVNLTTWTPHVKIHVVGGPNSVPDARFDDIVAAVGDPSKVSWDRITPHANRFELASSVAARMKDVADGGPKTMTSIALIANGHDPDKFFDALALSPIAARNGAPILLVGEDYVPWQTSSRLASLGFPRVIVGGGPATVNSDVYTAVGATERWWGYDRYATASEIASQAVGEGALDINTVGVAAKLPDALTGGAATGMMGGALVLTQSDWVPDPTYEYVEGCG
jgi:putative cell wall-binding protein